MFKIIITPHGQPLSNGSRTYHATFDPPDLVQGVDFVPGFDPDILARVAAGQVLNEMNRRLLFQGMDALPPGLFEVTQVSDVPT